MLVQSILLWDEISSQRSKLQGADNTTDSPIGHNRSFAVYYSCGDDHGHNIVDS